MESDDECPWDLCESDEDCDDEAFRTATSPATSARRRGGPAHGLGSHASVQPGAPRRFASGSGILSGTGTAQAHFEKNTPQTLNIKIVARSGPRRNPSNSNEIVTIIRESFSLSLFSGRGVYRNGAENSPG